MDQSDENDDLNNALRSLAGKELNQIPVMANGQMVGLLSRADIIRFFQTRQELGIKPNRQIPEYPPNYSLSTEMGMKIYRSFEGPSAVGRNIQVKLKISLIDLKQMSIPESLSSPNFLFKTFLIFFYFWPIFISSNIYDIDVE